jgi:protein phosphatase
MKSLKLSTTALTDVGQTRERNQDHVYAWAENPKGKLPRGLLVVADGMGGHRDGEVASKLAVEGARDTLQQWLLDFEGEYDLDLFAQQIAKAYEAANKAIMAHAEKQEIAIGNIGTTMECLILWNNIGVLGHVGDSRGYILRPEGLMQVTVDHSAVGELVEVGILQPDDRYTHPNRNILTRGLGSDMLIEVDIVDFKLGIGQRVLLCSDGLWGMVRDSEIEKVLLQAASLDELVKALIKAANVNGGDDNIGVAMAEILPG